MGGRDEAAFGAVGLVVTPDGTCTGTLVAPRVVVTAQHCFSPLGMRDTGADMKAKYKETSRGGLAVNVLEAPPAIGVYLPEC